MYLHMSVDCEVTDKIEKNKYITAVWDMSIQSKTFFFIFHVIYMVGSGIQESKYT